MQCLNDQKQLLKMMDKARKYIYTQVRQSNPGIKLNELQNLMNSCREVISHMIISLLQV